MLDKAFISSKVNDSMLIIGIGIVIGVLYPVMSGEVQHIGRMLNGPVIGFIGSCFIVLNEIWLPNPFARQKRFAFLVLYKSLIYAGFFMLTIIAVLSVERAYEHGVSVFTFIGSEAFYQSVFGDDLHVILLYMLLATTSFIFVNQISKKMGQGVLWNFIIGKYHHAREEERIFMFMDLNNSTRLAETLGDIQYNNLLKDFFYDITDSIIRNYGEIYRYVGDEVVVSWKVTKGLPEARFLRTFFAARKAIRLKQKYYKSTYGLVPRFSAGFNHGKVVVGEIGEVKSQICFFGQVMYETTELEKGCKQFSTDNLVAETLLEKVELPAGFMAGKEGIIKVPGGKAIAVYSVKEV